MKSAAYAFKSLFVAWLCLFSLANLNAIPDLVLCIGQDGHVELESAVGARCGGSEPAPPADPLLIAYDEAHCGGCSDISLISESTRSYSQRQLAAFQSELHPLGTAPAWDVLYLLRPRATPRISVAPMPPPALISIRSIRLLV